MSETGETGQRATVAGFPCCEHCRHEVQPDGHLVACRECQIVSCTRAIPERTRQ